MAMMSRTQNLRRDLEGLAAELKWSGVELVRIADRLKQVGNDPDAQALYRMINTFQREEERLSVIAKDVAAGRIIELSGSIPA